MKLVKSMYGARQAASNWEHFYGEVLKEMSFLQGTSNPCLFLHPERRIRVWVHGDDFVLLGIHADLMWAETAIGNKIKMKRTGLLGPEPGDDKETTCMNRLLRWNVSEDRIEWECDPRHSQITIEHVGLKSDSKGVVTPGLSVHPDANSAPLSASERSVYRSVTMRTAYQSVDRPELLFAAKEAARSMQNPTKQDFEKVKRIARYLVLHPRVVQYFPRQGVVKSITQYCDSDHAGCKVTRRSTSAGITMHGAHYIHAYSTTQKPVATSSGESEFYGIFKAGSRLLGMIGISRDFGLERMPCLRADASAGIAMASRRGVGKVRHLHTQALWIQQQIADKRLTLSKERGDHNIADLPTKHVDRAVMIRHLTAMNFHIVSGASKLAKGIARDA
jgi:hypothetical protein